MTSTKIGGGQIASRKGTKEIEHQGSTCQKNARILREGRTDEKEVSSKERRGGGDSDASGGGRAKEFPGGGSELFGQKGKKFGCQAGTIYRGGADSENTTLPDKAIMTQMRVFRRTV